MNEILDKYKDKNTELSKLSDELEVLIYKALNNALFDQLDYDYGKVPDLDEMKKTWVIWKNFSNNEFSFNMKFGNIDYLDLVKLNTEMLKIGFQVSCIFANDDTYKNKNGLEITFSKSEICPSEVRVR